MELSKNAADINLPSKSTAAGSNIPLIKLLRLFNKCYSKWPFIAMVVLHISALVYYLVYMKILYPNKFDVLLNDGTIVEIIPDITIRFISPSLSPIYNHFTSLLVVEMIYIEHGHILQEIFREYLEDVILIPVFIALSIRYFDANSMLDDFMGKHFPAINKWIFLIILFALLYRFRDLNLKYVFPQLLFCVESVLIAVANPLDMSILSIDEFIFSLGHFTPIDDSEAIGFPKTHYIHDVIDVLVKKYKIDKAIVLLTGIVFEGMIVYLSLGFFSLQTLFSGYIALDPLEMLHESHGFVKFVSYHEYGHIYQNIGKYLRFFDLFQRFATLFVLYSAIYLNSRSNKPKDKIRFMLILLSYSCLVDSICDGFKILLGSYFEFRADDFSQSLHNDISGINAFFLSEKERSKLPTLRFLMLYPPWLPYADHPSVYHRLMRQVSKFNN